MKIDSVKSKISKILPVKTTSVNAQDSTRQEKTIKEHSFIHRWNSGVEIVYNPFKNGIMPINMRNKMFPKDAKYRAELAHSLGVSNPNSLSAVVGSQELKTILKNSKSTNFVPQLGDDNKPTNPDFSINLHIHSKYSDGCLDVQDILDQAQQYAEETSKPFLFSISDHDSLEGTKEALELIAKNPEKYNKILFVPSIELNVKYQNPSITRPEVGRNYAYQLEVLGYSINPFNKKLNEFIQELKTDNLQVVDGIFDAFQTMGLDVDLEEARTLKKSGKGNRTHLYYLGSAGIIDDAKSYIYSKAKLIQDDNERQEMYKDIESYFETYRLEYGSRNLMPKTLDLKQAVHLLTNGGYGFVGIAHPAKIGLDGANQFGNFALKKIIDDFIKFGGSAMEYNYQYTGTEGNQEYCDWIDSINKYYNDVYPKSVKAGGIDTHGTNIFKR